MKHINQDSAAPERQQLQAAHAGKGGVGVAFADGHESQFPAIWLRHNCECRECGSTCTARRELRLTDIPIGIKASRAVIAADGSLEVTWEPGGHRSHYPASWLRGHCLSAKERSGRRLKPTLWSPGTPDIIRYESFPALADRGRRLAYLERLRDFGFIILTDIPEGIEATEAVAATVGLLRITNYGVYELISRPSPQLVGDSSVALAPHTDEPYRHHPPGITFFHVVAQSDHGGESTIVDGFKVAEQLKAEDPEAFRLLSTIPVDFHRELKEGRIFHASAPIIRVDRHGQLDGLRLLDRGTAPFDLAESEVDSYYAAYRKLLSILYDTSNQLIVKIRAGEVLVFNNHRLLHGRTAFDASKSFRHVRSANVDLDEFYSSLRVLYAELGREELYMRFPQGSST
jgi:gamma-butyrobetaine dioxygenase